jgi:hypothetical protein
MWLCWVLTKLQLPGIRQEYRPHSSERQQELHCHRFSLIRSENFNFRNDCLIFYNVYEITEGELVKSERETFSDSNIHYKLI